MKKYLMLYENGKKENCIGWFDDENEIYCFIRSNDIKEIYEVLDLLNSRVVEEFTLNTNSK